MAKPHPPAPLLRGEGGTRNLSPRPSPKRRGGDKKRKQFSTQREKAIASSIAVLAPSPQTPFDPLRPPSAGLRAQDRLRRGSESKGALEMTS